MTNPDAAGERRAAGRPRSATKDQAILEATVRLLARDGYQALSIEAVAAEAGVGRPTIYRRYESKAALVAAALAELTRGEPPRLPADPRRAVLTLLGATARAIATPGGMTIIGTLLAQEARDPELVRIFREDVFRPRHAIVRHVLAQAVAAGEIDPSTDIAVVLDVLFGALLARAVSGLPADEQWLERVVNTVWHGMRVTGER